MKYKIFWNCVAFLVLLMILFGIYGRVYGARVDEDEFYSVVSVIDGDTIKVKVKWKELSIRLLGINTPETVDPRKEPECYGETASKMTKQLLVNAKVSIRLEKDREEEDRYGRILAYIKREDGLEINEYLVMKGYAAEYTFGSPYSRQKLFQALEKNAKKDRKGLWGKCKWK